MKESRSISAPVKSLPGVGDVRAKALEKMGISTIRDLLHTYPRGYEDRGNIRTLSQGADGKKSAFLLTVANTPKTVRLRGHMTITKFRAFDETGSVDVVFYNQEYVRQVFTPGAVFRFWGSLNYSKVWTLSSPAYEAYYEGKELPDFVSLYPLTAGISRKVMEGLVDSALAIPYEDYLPESIRLRQGFPTLTTALRSVHRPQNQEELQAGLRRLVFDEIFCISLGIALNRSKAKIPTVPLCKKQDLTPLLQRLPFALTDAQKRCVDQILGDICGDGNGPAMRRILIGDVGSGKTACAMAAMYAVAKAGYQSALMAPTEILARQHHRDIQEIFSPLGIEVACLCGSTPSREKRRILEDLASPDSKISIVVGTHALLSDNVKFARLLFTVTDEQHRFGILQRSTLSEKSHEGHLLVMSATPIPRTLALSLYGDLSISRLDELPPGRQVVDTFVVDEAYRDRLNGFIGRHLSEGGQVYVVCPAIEEESEEDSPDVPLTSLSPTLRRPMKNVLDHTNYLRQAFPDATVGILHGKMKSDEKEAVMTSFLAGDISILVCTTVIEVGVNAPNATLMVVENAENFGLSQLHQLRGRVGRSHKKSYCVLVSDHKGDLAGQRLKIMADSHDGYEIAEKDLLLRGPGDFFSGAADSEMRQSGGLHLKLAEFCDDPALMTAAFGEASRVIQADPYLSQPQHQSLAQELHYYFKETSNEIS